MDNIALAFSGGGFRAACFSLGSLSYLNHVQYKGKPLLQQVSFISSTSGGSITNLVYSAHLFTGRSFADCYAFLYQQLDGEKLLSAAVSHLNGGPGWKGRPHKSRNLINAFSIAYDTLLEQQTLGLFSNRDQQPHLEEICVNATEFTNGLPFRFQSQHPGPGIPNGLVGNHFICFAPGGMQAAAKIRLADILASSSCFPSGFEPMIFPNDYTYDTLDQEQLRAAIRFTANTFTLKSLDDEGARRTAVVPPPAQNGDTAYRSGGQPIKREMKRGNVDWLADEEFNKKLHFGLMDGGIDDNQAINAFEAAYKRREDNHRPVFDLFIACDVTSNFLDGYTLPIEKKTWYNSIPIYGILLLWLAGITLPLWFLTPGRAWTGRLYILTTISVMLALPLIWLGGKLVKQLFTKKKDGSAWTSMLAKYGPAFLRLRLGVLKQMIALRVKSVFLLANDIYLKQVRRMYYNEVFSNPRYKDITIQNAIYDLSKVKFGDATPASGGLQPSPEMIQLAEQARMMGTTLWFDATNGSDRTKEAIIATGQFTTCYNLLKYLGRQPTGGLTPDLLQLKKDLEADWEAFLINARRLL